MDELTKPFSGDEEEELQIVSDALGLGATSPRHSVGILGRRRTRGC